MSNERARRARGRGAGAVLAALVVGVTVAGGVQAATAAPAAAVSGLTTRVDESALNSTATKHLIVHCPAGTYAVGGGATLLNTQGGIEFGARVVAAMPTGNASGSGYSIVASEQQIGTTRSWKIVGQALCAPTASVPGIDYEFATSDTNSHASNSVTVTCPAGKKVLGMGGEAWYNNPNDRSQVVLTDIRPNGTLSQVTVEGYEDETGFAGNWNVTAMAVCVNPRSGQQPVADIVDFSDAGEKTALPVCPAGTVVHSVGFSLSLPAGRGGEAQVTRMRIAGPAAEIVASNDSSGLDAAWRLRGYAICAA